MGGDLLLQHLAALLAVGDVKAQHPSGAAGGLQGLEGLPRALGVAMVMNADGKTVRRQLAGDGAADALAGTGH